ncbi:OLC1v1011415C1 [Oldenlandia corymbosa var. corymbosa]|uniref:OLC1v1011415C1 n=1 Tax=Oldenlandia corymbosa var. corymbosa TaxID=529605 RepID=A0AAV1DX18_OLDCO|nr:OLC1v1011415C1 [Oldenlandia corymbosa var. corymbosa]
MRSYSEPRPEVCRVPFSWEEKPGTPKLNLNPNQTYEEKPAEELIRATTNVIQVPLPKSTSFEIHIPGNAVISWGYTNMELSPPPIRAQQWVPCKSSSRKSFWKQDDDDPFAAAIKKCTKSITIRGMGPPGGIQNSIQPYKEKNQKVNFSCKTSCDVRDDNLVRLVNCIIPPLPRGFSAILNPFPFSLIIVLFKTHSVSTT